MSSHSAAKYPRGVPQRASGLAVAARRPHPEVDEALEPLRTGLEHAGRRAHSRAAPVVSKLPGCRTPTQGSAPTGPSALPSRTIRSRIAAVAVKGGRGDQGADCAPYEPRDLGTRPRAADRGTVPTRVHRR